jgi:hypothetical protein
MKKWILTLITAAAASSVFAEPITLTGVDAATKSPCTLTIEDWRMEPNVPQDWYALRLKVKTSYQNAGNPALEIQYSFTPYSLYGKSQIDAEKIAVVFETDNMSPEGIQSFLFQSWTEKVGLLQTSCRIK